MKTFGLKAKFTILTIAIGLVGSAALSVNIIHQWRTLDELNQGIVRSAATTILDKLDRNLFERYGDVQAFATSDPARSSDPVRVTAFMNEMMGIYAPIYDIMVFADANGKVLAANVVDKNGKTLDTSRLMGMDVSDRDWFRRNVSGDIKPGTSNIEDLYTDKDIAKILGTDGFVMAFSAPVRNKEGKPLGVWRNYVSWKDVVTSMIDEEVKKLQTPKMPQIFPAIIAKNGMTLLDTMHQESVLTKMFLPPEELASPDKIKDRRFKIDSALYAGDLREAMVASKGYSTYPGIGWRLAIRVPDNDSDLRLALFMGLGSLLLLCLAVILGYRFTSKTTAYLIKIEAELVEAAKKAHAATQAISGAADAVAESVNEQAAAVQETAASMEEMNAMVRKCADNAEQSRKASILSQEAMERGRSSVKDMIGAIDEINTSNTNLAQQVEESNRKLVEVTRVIGEIGAKTKVINEIVFQTKLLSFNASVEAARAGEHGKGFAVVAEEVGNLAQMSGKAAKEITDLLETSTHRVSEIVSDTKTRVETALQTGRQKVETGVRLAHDCDNSLEEIARSVSDVGTMVSEISAATAETASGLAEIGHAIHQIDQVTHKNAVGSSTAAAEAGRVSERVDHITRVASELATLVSGHESRTAHSTPSAQARSTMQPRVPVVEVKDAVVKKSNVVNLNRAKGLAPEGKIAATKNTPSMPPQTNASVVGSGITPSANDPRFEEV